MIDLSEYKDGDRVTVTLTGAICGGKGYLTMATESGAAVALCNIANVADSIKRAAPKWQEGDVVSLENAMRQATYIRSASGIYRWRDAEGDVCYSDDTVNGWLDDLVLWYVHDGQYVDLRK